MSQCLSHHCSVRLVAFLLVALASPILLAIRRVPIKSEFGTLPDQSFSTFLSLDFHDDDGCSHTHLPLIMRTYQRSLL